MSCPQSCAARPIDQEMRYYHVSWMTMNNVPVLDCLSRAAVLERLRREALALGCEVAAAECACDRVEILLGLPPRFPLAGVVRCLKSASSHGLDLWRIPEFMWDEEYGAESVAAPDLPLVMARLGTGGRGG